jgi:hypothetical protein
MPLFFEELSAFWKKVKQAQANVRTDDRHE